MIAYGILNAVRKMENWSSIYSVQYWKRHQILYFADRKCSFNSWLSAPTLIPKCKGFKNDMDFYILAYIYVWI